MLRTGYYIDDFQATYFVIDSFEDLFDLLKGTRLHCRIREIARASQPYSPFEILPQDKVMRKGTGEFWRDFPATKTKLK